MSMIFRMFMICYMQLKKRGVIVVRNISKGLSLILVFTLFLGSVFIPGNIASAEEGDDNRLKLQVISDDFKNYIYLYEEEGNNYKVIEKAEIGRASCRERV